MVDLNDRDPARSTQLYDEEFVERPPEQLQEQPLEDELLVEALEGYPPAEELIHADLIAQSELDPLFIRDGEYGELERSAQEVLLEKGEIVGAEGMGATAAATEAGLAAITGGQIGAAGLGVAAAGGCCSRR